jgi:Zn-dependent oligopeptidase
MFWLDKVVMAANAYNDQRLHTNFQEDEVLKFVEYIHRLYGITYVKPEPRHRNEPHKMGK